jgi:protein-disulfide isomerase
MRATGSDSESRTAGPWNETTMTLTPPVTSADHVQGDGNAPMTLVEFGDYECSFCAAAQDTIKALQDEFGGRLRFVFRNFPLVQVHPNALAAAMVAEAAETDQFWRLHDLMYANPDRLDVDNLLGYAREAGIPEDKARAALDGATLSRVQRDIDSGESSLVQGTPAFFVNGRLHEGEWQGQELAHALLHSARAR